MRGLTSIHGTSLALAPTGTEGAAKGKRSVLAPGGFASGDHGNQIAAPSPSTVSFFEDFLGDVIPVPKPVGIVLSIGDVLLYAIYGIALASALPHRWLGPPANRGSSPGR